MLAAAGTAEAATPTCVSPHCYAVYADGRFTGGDLPMNGALADLEVDCLAVHSITSQWLNNEIWMSTNTTGAPNDWLVEGGFKAGAADGSHYGFQFWWDDHRNGSESDHFIRTATTGDVGVYRNMTFSWVYGTFNWNVYFAGSLVGTSTNNGDSVGHGIEAGVEEANTNTGIAWTHVHNVQYNNGSSWVAAPNLGRIHTDYSNLTLSALGSSGGLPAWSVSTTNGRCGDTPAFTAPPAQPATSLAAAESRALQVAQQYGAKSTETVRVVRTTRAQAVAFDCGDVIDTPDANDAVYLIQFVGDFTGHGSPAGGRQTAGGVLWMSVDAETGQMVDIALTGPSSASLSALGPVTTATITATG